MERNFRKKYTPVEKMLDGGASQGRKLYADAYHYGGEPIIISEYGGIAFGTQREMDWGYHKDAADVEELLSDSGSNGGDFTTSKGLWDSVIPN